MVRNRELKRAVASMEGINAIIRKHMEKENERK